MKIVLTNLEAWKLEDDLCNPDSLSYRKILTDPTTSDLDQTFLQLLSRLCTNCYCYSMLICLVESNCWLLEMLHHPRLTNPLLIEVCFHQLASQPHLIESLEKIFQIINLLQLIHFLLDSSSLNLVTGLN